MNRVVTVVLLVLLVPTVIVGIAGAQEDATALSDCNPDSDTYESCLVAHSTAQDVLDWMNQSPDELTQTQKDAIYAVSNHNASQSEFTNETLSRLDEWKQWDNDLVEEPDWFGSTEETSTPTNETTTTPEQDADAPDKKWRQIRSGQWIVSKPTYDDDSETGTIRIYSEFDGGLAVVDNIDCRGAQNGCKPDVTNFDVDGGETTEITFSASTASNGYQSGTLNSFDNAEGEIELAVMLLADTDDQNPWEAGPSKWDYVFAFAGSILGFGLIAVVLTAIYIKIKNRETSFNSYDKLHRRT